jgi:hypothetical protein
VLNYQVHVEGIEIAGHPITIYASNLMVASLQLDELVKKYPYNRVTLEELTVSLLKESTPLEVPIPSCPRGCKGVIDGKPVVRRGSIGKAYCTICDWREK